MRSTFANFAILASTLLVKDVLAAPHNHAHYDLHKRDLYVVVDNIMVTEEVTVTQEADGSLVTGAGVVVGTATIAGSPSLVSSSAPVSSSVVVPTTSSTPVPVAPISSSVPAPVDPATSSAAVFIQPPKPTTTPAPVPATTAAPVVVQPTTLATVAAPIPTIPSAPITSSSNKRGLAYNDASLLSAFTSSSKVSWAYNWGAGTASIPSSFNYAPMLWGLGSHTDGWSAAASAAIASGSTHLLSFNEPDLGAQSNLNPGDAAAGFKEFMQPFAGKAKLVSPAVTNGGSPMGLTWLTDFISACNGCQIDAVAFHWYNGGGADQFQEYVAQAYAAGGNRPLHITEFQASGSLDEQSAFLEQVIPFLDSSPMVERYAYFGVFQGNLVDGNALSSLGDTFASFV